MFKELNNSLRNFISTTKYEAKKQVVEIKSNIIEINNYFTNANDFQEMLLSKLYA